MDLLYHRSRHTVSTGGLKKRKEKQSVSYLGPTGWSQSWAETGHSGFLGILLDT